MYLNRFYTRFETFCRYEPYHLDIYEALIKKLKSEKKYNFLRLKDYPENIDKKKINVILRHDIDRALCVRNIEKFLKIEEKENVRSSSYILVDQVHYDPSDCISLINKYNPLGFEFGLHSACYMHSDFMERFNWEVKEFSRIFKIRPESFTQHGMGKKYFADRTAFNQEVAYAKKINDIKVTDCAAHDLQYSFKITDARMDEKERKRYIGEYFTSFPQIPFAKGDVFLILTHPCYWIDGHSKEPT